MKQTSTDAVQTYSARDGMGSGMCGGNAGARGRPEIILVVTCHMDGFGAGDASSFSFYIFQILLL